MSVKYIVSLTRRYHLPRQPAPMSTVLAIMAIMLGGKIITPIRNFSRHYKNVSHIRNII